MPYYLVIILISIGASFFSGLLGIGGGIIIVPSYLFLIPFLEFDSFSVNTITGIAATQALAGSFFAYRSHLKYGLIEKAVAYKIIMFAALGAFSGAVASKFISEYVLLIIYLFLLAIAGISVLNTRKDTSKTTSTTKADYTPDRPTFTKFIVYLSTLIAGAMGFGGAVTFIPILNHFFKMPLKTAISTVTFLVFMTTSVTFSGKLIMGLVPIKLIPFILIGSVIGAKVGANLNKKLSPQTLKTILLLVIIIIWIRIFLTVIG